MRRRRRLRVTAAAVLLLAVAAATVIVVHRGGFASSLSSAHVETSAPPVPVGVAPKIHAVAANAPVPVPAALGAVLSPLAGASALGTLTGRVADPESGAVLWDADSAKPQLPASTAKVLTVAAALLTLDTAGVVHTKVVAGTVPGQIVLVGGGDPTLSAAPPGAPEHYPGAARLDDLVAQVRSSGVAVSSVVVDTSAYSGDTLASGWFAADIGGGSIAPIEPVMLDGARSDPMQEDPPRSGTPALDVGRALAARLGVSARAVSAGRAGADARVLADVSSAPLSVRLEQLMLASGDVLTETVGREVALARGLPVTFAGAAAAVAAALTDAGVDVSGLTMSDTSGLSVLDRAPARVLTDVLTKAAADGPHGAALRPLLSMLPVAAASGTLTDRFGRAAAQPGAGWVRAKTGSLSGVNSLAGIVTDVDGRVLVFALLSNGSDAGAARPALDAIAAALRTCGCR